MAKDISKSEANSYVVAGCKPWNHHAFDQLGGLPGKWHFISEKSELTPSLLDAISPRYVFFLHWSWKVPEEVFNNHECVCFHMTDVPYGRGGSPLQNLIVRRHRETVLTALRMTSDFDAGPVYLKEPMSLDGGAEEIYLRADRLSAKMIQRIIMQEAKPKPQRGKSVNFRRRKPEESEITAPRSLDELHDFIRMLDAEGYPRAFIDLRGFRFELSRSALYDGRIIADVTITRAARKNSK